MGTVRIADCPTCGQPLAARSPEPIPCAVINPSTQADVLPLRCTLTTGHDGPHYHPPLWSDSPSVRW